MKSDLTRLENKSTYVDLKMTQTKLKNSLYGRNFGHVIFSVSVKDIFQKVTDAWFLKFVRQRENCQESMTPRTFSFGVTLYPSNTNKNKKAELPQRWLRDAPYVWVHGKFLTVPEYAHSYFSRNF